MKSAGVENIKEPGLQPLQDQQLRIKMTSPWRLKDGTEGLAVSFADVAHIPNYLKLCRQLHRDACFTKKLEKLCIVVILLLHV